MARGEMTMYDGEERFVRKDGKLVWVHLSAAVICDVRGTPIRVAAIVKDITARKKMENKIKHMALHDPLTGLPNKRFFQDIVNLEIAEARRNKKKLAILFLDLDGFKNVNDSLGHETGDQLLMEVAARLKSAIRASDMVARIGGDEFNIVLGDIVHAEDSAEIAGKILECVRQPFRLTGREVHVSASIGIVIYPDDGQEVDVLFRYADIAMYHAKELGKNTYKFYNPQISRVSLARIRMESELRRSLKKKELMVLYQPLIDLVSRRIVSAEALVRWRHPDLGLLKASAFVPLAEETGFITAIDKWVVETACSQAVLWRKAELPPLGLTVNLSARHFQSPGFPASFQSILQRTGMEPHRLDFEITEEMIMQDVQRSAECLRQLVELGSHISIADFGTGYSSLGSLNRLPIERLKIAKSFIQDVATNPDNQAIVVAITDMAHTMRMRVVAEGVETVEQLDFLVEKGCDEVQGFFFGELVSADKITEMASTFV
jgi:diguanylate cyclase (GGDEF)-like protein